MVCWSRRFYFRLTNTTLMNRNKVAAWIIILVVYLGPFYYLFIRNNGSEIVDTGKEMLFGVSWIIGMIVAFYFAVNEPLKPKQTAAKAQKAASESQRKAA